MCTFLGSLISSSVYCQHACVTYQCKHMLEVWAALTPQISFFRDRDKRCAPIKQWKIFLKGQWLTSMKLTNKGDIDCRVQLLPSFPPSLMFDPVDVKAGFLTKEPVWRGRKHHVIPFFVEKPLILFFSEYDKTQNALEHINDHVILIYNMNQWINKINIRDNGKRCYRYHAILHITMVFSTAKLRTLED